MADMDQGEGPASPTMVLLLRQVAAIMKDWLDEHPATGRDLMVRLGDDARQATGLPRSELVASLQAAGSWLADHDYCADAEPILVEVVSTLRATADTPPADLASALMQLGGCQLHLGRYLDAETSLRESLGLRQSHLAAGHWQIGSAQSFLGATLVGQGRYEEAEPILLAGYETLMNDPETNPQRKREVVERLVELYDGWGRGEDAAHWRRRLPGPDPS